MTTSYPTTTLKDILTKDTYNKFGDLDVYSDCIDDCADCWCGTLLTERGERLYEDTLRLPAEVRVCFGSPAIMVYTDHLATYARSWIVAKKFFGDLAGYCSEEEWDLNFYDCDTESEPEEAPKEEPTTVFSINIIDDESRIAEDGWDFPLEEVPYLLAEHEGETFVYKGGRLYEAKEV